MICDFCIVPVMINTIDTVNEGLIGPLRQFPLAMVALVTVTNGWFSSPENGSDNETGHKVGPDVEGQGSG